MTTTSSAWTKSAVRGDTMRGPAPGLEGTIPPPQPPQPPQQSPTLEATHLGQKSTYTDKYDRTQLVAIPRNIEREKIGITGQLLPFIGVDVWNCYELSALTGTGRPWNGICKIAVNANSPNIVESKSLKLYLNSFNMTENSTRDRMSNWLRTTIQADLTELLGIVVDVGVWSIDEVNKVAFLEPFDLDGTSLVNLDKISTTNDPFVYNEDPSLLEDCMLPVVLPLLKSTNTPKYNVAISSALRSNCKVTNQPDWGTIVVATDASSKIIDSEKLLRYITSLRHENHFHEEVCELVYKRLSSATSTRELAVGCFYTRRGGIDINPIRGSNPTIIEEVFNSYSLTTGPSFKLVRQ